MKRLSSGNRCLTINESRTMKKIYSFMVAAVALFAAASCNKELPQENLPAVGETVVYTASTDGADTKAVLNEDTKKSEWVADDAITVHDGTKGWTFIAAEAGANVDFSNSEEFGDYRPVMAVYPAGTYTVDVAVKTAKAYIPTWQQAQAGTYHSSAALAVAYSEGNTFAFKNAHALLKFTVNTDNVTHVIFHGNGSEAITGDVYVTLGEDGVESVECLETEFTEQQWNEETQQNEDVKVKKYGTWVECYAYHDDANKYFAKGQTYYIAVAPQKFEGGVTVKVKIDGGEELVAKTTTKPVETKINTILNLGEIKYEAPVVHEWAVAGTFNGWSTTANPMELVDGYYVVRNVTGLNFTAQADPEDLSSSTGIKFVNKAAWRGGEGKVTAGTWAYVWGDGGNIYVEGASADKAYDIYLNPNEGDYGKFVIVPDGDPMPEDGVETPEQPEEVTPGETSEWALTGAFNSWADKYFETTNVANFLVCKSVQIKAAEGFLVRKPSTEWNDKYGAGNVNYLKANHYIVTSKNGADMCLEADGTYDIYFDVNAKTIYVMAAGQDYATATEQTANGEEPKQEEPEVTEKVVYLKPNSNWTQSNARFAAYFWGGAVGEKWVSMTAVGDGTYEAHLPEGYDYGCNVIFCRMNPSTTANNWNNKWNQTSDLKTPTDGKNLYTVKSGTWDKGGGTWSVK